MGFYFQHSFKPQSIFAAFNSLINFNDNGSNPFDTGYSYANAATGVFNQLPRRRSSSRCPEWRYKNSESYAQDNWKPNRPADARLRRRGSITSRRSGTRRCKRRILPGPVQPERRREALYAGVHRHLPVREHVDRRGMDPALIAAGVDADAGQYGGGALHRPAHARVRTASTARSRQARGSTTAAGRATRSASRPASAWSTT